MEDPSRTTEPSSEEASFPVEPMNGTPYQRIVLGLSYAGSAYSGWQAQAPQAGTHTLEATLQQAIECIAGVPVRLVCAGRTDAGVHARRQVVHFDCQVSRPITAWVRGVNAHLPHDLAVHGAVSLPLNHEPNCFHARFSAILRVYRYYFYTARTRNPLLPFATWLHQSIDVPAMQEASSCLLGTHDFSSFRASQCQAKSPVRTLYRIDWGQENGLYYAEIAGNAFLHHMVRNLMGALFAVGMGKQPMAWLKATLNAKDRTQSERTFPSDGLVLWDVQYPAHFPLHGLHPE